MSYSARHWRQKVYCGETSGPGAGAGAGEEGGGGPKPGKGGKKARHQDVGAEKAEDEETST